MIDFTKFVNSNAVRNHLQQIRYQPTAMEAAWLVWQCETISLEEKYTAVLRLFEAYVDALGEEDILQLTRILDKIVSYEEQVQAKTNRGGAER